MERVEESWQTAVQLSSAATHDVGRVSSSRQDRGIFSHLPRWTKERRASATFLHRSAQRLTWLASPSSPESGSLRQCSESLGLSARRTGNSSWLPACLRITSAMPLNARLIGGQSHASRLVLFVGNWVAGLRILRRIQSCSMECCFDVVDPGRGRPRSAVQ